MTKLITRSSSHHKQSRREKRGLSFCPQNNKEPFKSPINGTVPFLVLGRAIRLAGSTQPALQCQLRLRVQRSLRTSLVCSTSLSVVSARDGMSGTDPSVAVSFHKSGYDSFEGDGS